LVGNAIAANANADPGQLGYRVGNGRIKNVWANPVGKMIRCFKIYKRSVTLTEHSGLKFNKIYDFQHSSAPGK